MSEIVKQFDPLGQSSHITMTSAALSHVKNIIAKRGKGIGIRLATKKSGCSGYKYHVEIIEKIVGGDHIFKIDDQIVVAVSRTDLPLVKGTELDYVKEGLNAHFIYRNPNEAGNCGCGESFSVK